MAKYFGSPWGFLRGKMGNAVGGRMEFVTKEQIVQLVLKGGENHG